MQHVQRNLAHVRPMPGQHNDLPFGLYERLITAGLKARLLSFDPAHARVVKAELDPAEAHAMLARHIEEVVARALNDLPQEDRAARQSQLANQIIGLLAASPAAVGLGNDLLESPPEQLCAIQSVTGMPSDDREVVSPLVALSASDLLVNARCEPALAHALARYLVKRCRSLRAQDEP